MSKAIDPIYPWQQAYWQRLQEAHKKQQLAHAYLFSGPAGLGKNSFAKHFAASLLCTHFFPTEKICGQCHACHMLSAHSHPDQIILKPEDQKKTIGVEQIRQLSSQLFNSPHSGQRRVVILPEAHLLTLAAANALLKTLEEPGDDIIFLFITEHLYLLPITLRSRCQLLSFTPLSQTQVTAYLQEHDAPCRDQAIIANLCQGAPLKSQLWQQALTKRQDILQALHTLIEGQAEPCAIAEHYQAIEMTILISCLYSYISDCIRLKMHMPKDSIINQDCFNTLQITSDKFALQPLFDLLDRILTIKQQQDSPYHLNRQACLEDFL